MLRDRRNGRQKQRLDRDTTIRRRPFDITDDLERREQPEPEAVSEHDDGVFAFLLFFGWRMAQTTSICSADPKSMRR